MTNIKIAAAARRARLAGLMGADLNTALSKSLQMLFVVSVTLGTLAGSGLVLWLLSVLATSRYGIYFGV